jgi:hypothetical protein
LTTVVQEVADGNEHQPERGEDQNEGGGGVRVVRPYLDGRVVQGAVSRELVVGRLDQYIDVVRRTDLTWRHEYESVP